MSDIVKKIQLTSMEQIVILSQPMLDAGKAVKFTVVGDSMFPIFRNNKDKVTIVKSETVKKRDVILYRRKDGSYVLHRVVGKGKLGYKLCGDNQLAVEYPVEHRDVVGVMTSFERNGREIKANCPWYRIYSFLWCLFIPLRPIEFKVAYKLKNLFKRSK